jgi:hypothetical protein
MSDRQIYGAAPSYLYAHNGVAFCKSCLNSLGSEYPQTPEERTPILEGHGVCLICGREGTILVARQ